MIFKPEFGAETLLQRSHASILLTPFADEAAMANAVAALGALATVLAHSFRLNAYPLLKRAFWQSLFAANVILNHEQWTFDVTDANEWLWAVEDERFPVLSLDLNNSRPLVQEHEDAVVAFFTTPPAHELTEVFASQCAQIHNMRVSLRLYTRQIRSACLALVERVLDRVYVVADRPFAVNRLELDNQQWSPPFLATMASIVTKCHSVYGIEQVDMSNSLLVPHAYELYAPLQRVIAAACDTSLAHRGSVDSAPKSHLTRFDPSWNDVQIEHFAALCSALRYGASITSLCLVRMFRCISDAERAQCWRWLAFAIFCPRSKTLARERRRLSVVLGDDPFTSTDASAFIETLSDPASALVYHGECRRRDEVASTVDELLLCTVKQGALFYKDAGCKGPVVHELARETVLEALGHDTSAANDHWTCVVLPGVGLGWVASDSVVHTEREVVDGSYLRDLDVEWSWVGLDESNFPVCMLLNHVGRHLSLLELSGERGEDTPLIPVVLEHCRNLKHLSVVGHELRDAEVDELFTALDGDFGDRLLSLDVRDTKVASHLLESFLSRRSRAPALQELRISGITHDGSRSSSRSLCDRLRHVLRANTALRWIELDEASASTDDYNEICSTIHDKRLPRPLTLHQKLAFVSVLQLSASAPAARQRLDSFLVASVFAFAATDVRRVVLWNTAS